MSYSHACQIANFSTIQGVELEVGDINIVYGYVDLDDDDPVVKATEDETEIDVYPWTMDEAISPILR